jgi:hypothetical protein
MHQKEKFYGLLFQLRASQAIPTPHIYGSRLDGDGFTITKSLTIPTARLQNWARRDGHHLQSLRHGLGK